MKVEIVLFTILLFMASIASAQNVAGFAEVHNSINKEGVNPELHIHVHGSLTDKLGWSFFSLTSEGYSVAYGGPTFKPVNWLEISTGIGIESSDSPLRFGHTIWLGQWRWSVLSINEHGPGSDYWFDHVATYKVANTWALGARAQKYIGAGPHLEKTIGKVTLWGTYTVDNKMGMTGFRFYF